MKTLKVKVSNRSGLHARPAAVFVQTARKFKSRITVRKLDKAADSKNILQLLALGVDMGDEIEIVAEGPDEEEAIAELGKLLTEVLPSIDK
ncbi:HPr family phosphocarrier protein [Thermofilum pendens]|uniref:Phosphotransferase system, phosphocarrier protein HPr n=1 Tax=Thermofilum pendens (strain DSM 2475 / Hrk 5) TaxID=368408 RepID=A1RZ60_THEPD|nr:HPr family phosphocarrier protein [Thermofilum pendens]ABL78490.1 Phosphotransferase system, phosphocarrier protein HPr [Thermofilum pendens Hrk 5]